MRTISVVVDSGKTSPVPGGSGTPATSGGGYTSHDVLWQAVGMLRDADASDRCPEGA